MSDWRVDLDVIHRRVSKRDGPAVSWEVTVERARRTALAVSVLDAAAISVDELHDATVDELPAGVSTALERIAPGFDLDVLASYPQSAMDGLANAVKGALFELEVSQLVEAGDIPLPEGVAEFALVESFNTPGIDAQLFDAHGDLIDVVQLKASGSADLIAHHLQSHPEVTNVWTTSEAALDAGARGFEGVFDTGLSDVELAALVDEALGDQASTAFSEVVDEALPQLAFLLVGLQAAWRLSRGEPADSVLADVRRRATSATALSVIAWLAAAATGSDAVRVPVVLAVTGAKIVNAELDGSARRLSNHVQVLEGLRPAG